MVLEEGSKDTGLVIEQLPKQTSQVKVVGGVVKEDGSRETVLFTEQLLQLPGQVQLVGVNVHEDVGEVSPENGDQTSAIVGLDAQPVEDSRGMEIPT